MNRKELRIKDVANLQSISANSLVAEYGYKAIRGKMRCKMMQNKSGLLLIFLGLLMTVVIYFFLQNRYISQSAWIKADVTLDSISNTDPLHSNVEDMSYYGVYYFNINGNYIKLCSAKVSDPKYIDNQMIFYINPNNYNDYHPQYEQNTKYLSLLALLISFIGIIDLLNNKKKRRNKRER